MTVHDPTKLLALVAKMSLEQPRLSCIHANVSSCNTVVLKGDSTHCADKPATGSSESAAEQDRPQQRKGSREK